MFEFPDAEIVTFIITLDRMNPGKVGKAYMFQTVLNLTHQKLYSGSLSIESA